MDSDYYEDILIKLLNDLGKALEHTKAKAAINEVRNAYFRAMREKAFNERYRK